MKYWIIIKAFALAFGTFILGGIVIGIVRDDNNAINIMQTIYYLAAVVAFGDTCYIKRMINHKITKKIMRY